MRLLNQKNTNEDILSGLFQERKQLHNGSSINDVTFLGWRRVQSFCGYVLYSLSSKERDDGGGGLKIVQYFVTSFMDDP